MIGQSFTVTEAKCSMIKRMLICTVWSVERLASYTMSAPKTVIILHNAVETIWVQFKDIPVRLQAHIVELSSYNCSFESRDGLCAVQGRIV